AWEQLNRSGLRAPVPSIDNVDDGYLRWKHSAQCWHCQYCEARHPTQTASGQLDGRPGRTRRRHPMSHRIRSPRRRPLVVTGLLLLGLAATAAGNPSQATIDRSRKAGAYFAEFTGVGSEGRDMVWRGAVAGVAAGEMTVRLAHVGRDVDTAKPTWPVDGIIFVSGEDPQQSFAADVHGTIDWRTKRVKLTGDVSVGYMKGAHVEQTA